MPRLDTAFALCLGADSLLNLFSEWTSRNIKQLRPLSADQRLSVLKRQVLRFGDKAIQLRALLDSNCLPAFLSAKASRRRCFFDGKRLIATNVTEGELLVCFRIRSANCCCCRRGSRRIASRTCCWVLILAVVLDG